jgi:hypothetical protein
MANWRLKTGSAVQAALQNLGAILSDPASFMLSPEELIALTSPEEHTKQRDEFDFTDDDAALASSPKLKDVRKRKHKSKAGRGSEGHERNVESRQRSGLRNEEERLQMVSASDVDDDPVVSRSEEPAASAAPSTSPVRQSTRRKRVITAAGSSSDSDDNRELGSKQQSEPTPVTEVRKRRPVVLSDDEE